MRLTSSDDNWFPIWTPDGKRVTFSRTEKSGCWRILSVSADGSGEAKSLFESDKPLFASSWSPSGDLAFVRQDWATLASDVWVLHTNDGKSEPILNTPFFEAYPEFSPDGRWLAFGSTSGQEQIEVYVQSYPGGNGKIKISGGVGWEPFWSRDGRRLYFTSNTRRGDEFQGEEYRSIGLMVVDVAAGPTFGPARVLLDYYGYELGSSPVRGEDLHPDGLRFLAPADIFGGKPVLRAEIPSVTCILV